MKGGLPSLSAQRLTCIVLLLAFFAVKSFAQSVNVPLDHWVYSFLDRLETRDLFVSEDYSTRPFSRHAIARMIAQIDQRVVADSSLFSNAEAGLFRQLKGEFGEALQDLDLGVSFNPHEGEPHLIRWDREDFRFNVDALLAQQFKLENKLQIESIPKSITSWGLRARGHIKKSLAYFAEARSFILSDIDSLANTGFNPDLGLPITERAFVDIIVTDNASGYLVFGVPWFDFLVGRDLIDWGPGYRGNLIVSRNSNFYDLFKISLQIKPFKFEHFHGFLNSDLTKYLAGHRLEIRPFRNFYFALNETVVYGNRSVEFLYFNPVIPIIIAERHLGNQDNNMFSFDFSLFLPRPAVKLYAEVLFDDFSFAKDIFRSFGNKWGVLVGGYWVNPFGLSNIDFRVEAVRIQPFVYSHRFAVNTYSNYNNVIGHWLGPDADDYYVELSRQFSRDVRFGITYEQTRRGPLNDFTMGTRPEDGRFVFLGGIVERLRIYGMQSQFQVRRDVFVRLGYQFIQSKNLRRELGNDQNNHRLFIALSLDF